MSQPHFARPESDGSRQGRKIFQQKNIFDRNINSFVSNEVTKQNTKVVTESVLTFPASPYFILMIKHPPSVHPSSRQVSPPPTESQNNF